MIPGKYGICIRVRIKPEVHRLMTRQARQHSARLAAGARYIVYKKKVYLNHNPKIVVMYQHNLNEFMDFIHGGCKCVRQ